MSGPPMTAAERAELDARLARMRIKPLWDGDRLLWSARDDADNSQVIRIPDNLCMANGRREPAGVSARFKHRPAYAGRSPGTFFLGRV